MEGACQVPSTFRDRLSWQRLVKVACAVPDALPTPTSSASRRVKDPTAQCTYTCPPEPLGAHWSCSQCWWRGEAGRTQGPSIFLPLWQGRVEAQKEAPRQSSPPASGLYHPISPHRSFCLCDLSSSLSLESVTHRSALTAFLLGLLECMSGPIPLCSR